MGREENDNNEQESLGEISQNEHELGNLDKILSQIGMGRWQITIFIINFLIWSIQAPHTMGSTLFNAPVEFKCLTPSNLSGCNFQSDTVGNSSLVYDSTCLENPSRELITKKEKFSNCTSEWFHKIGITERPSCPIVAYDTSVFTETVTTRWNLICESQIKRPLFQNAYTLGNIIGCVLAGTIADNIGRARAILLGSVIHVIFSSSIVVVPMFWFVLVARLIVGVSNLLVLIPAVTHAIETCPVSWRGPVGMFVGLPYSLWVMVFAVLGYLVRSWDYLYMLAVFPGAIPLIPLALLLDESPRWLTQNDQEDVAHKILLKAARLNKSEPETIQLINKTFQEQESELNNSVKNLSPTNTFESAFQHEDFEPLSLATRFSMAEGFRNSSRDISRCSLQFSELKLHGLHDECESNADRSSRYTSHAARLDQLPVEREQESCKHRMRSILRWLKSICHAFMMFVRTPYMRRISIFAPLSRFLCEFVYYGVIFNANNFSSGNPFVYVGLNGLADAMAVLVGVWASKAFSRRLTVGGGLLTSGILLFGVLLIPSDYNLSRLSCVMSGFLMCSIASQGFYVYLPELFPTNLRARGFSFSNLMGNFGVLLAPIISDVVSEKVWWASGVCLGCSGFAAGIFALMLPETKDMKLCEVVADIETRALGKPTSIQQGDGKF